MTAFGLSRRPERSGWAGGPRRHASIVAVIRVAIFGATGQVGGVMRTLSPSVISRSISCDCSHRRAQRGGCSTTEADDSLVEDVADRELLRHRHRALLVRQVRLARIRPDGRRGGGDRRRQLLGVAHGPRRAPRRARGQRRRAGVHREGDRRQPELHDHGRDAGAEAPARRGGPAPGPRRELPGASRVPGSPVSPSSTSRCTRFADGPVSLTFDGRCRRDARRPRCS